MPPKIKGADWKNLIKAYGEAGLTTEALNKNREISPVEASRAQGLPPPPSGAPLPGETNTVVPGVPMENAAPAAKDAGAPGQDAKAGEKSWWDKAGEETKGGVIGAATMAGAGLLSGLAQALMAEDKPQEPGRAGIPGGSPGAIKATSGQQMNYGGPRLPDRQNIAMEMLRLGGYK